MAFQLKYYLEFRTLKIGNTDLHRVELWQNTATILVAEEIKGAQSPITIEMPDLSHKFQVVRGRGATLNLLSDTDMKFFAGLEHIDPQEFKVIYLVAGVTKWVGYLNSDFQSEPYDIDFNYIITTTATDGFSLMDRYRFLQSDETKYTGLKSKWELLQICLNKVGLTYTDIRVKLATTFTGFSTAVDSTILHESFVNCANFYDEDGLAMTMREVIESILAPYGAFICQDNGSIYITDIHTMAGGGSVSFQRFNASTYAYISTTAETIEKTIASIGYFGTGHGIERSGGTNMQRVVYSPYPAKELIQESIVTIDEFTTVPAVFSDKDGYKYRTLVGNDTWIIASPADFEESCYTELTERFVYSRLPMVTNNIPLLQLINPIFITVSDATLTGDNVVGFNVSNYQQGASILITGKLLAKTKANPYDETYTPLEKLSGADKVCEHQLNAVVQIGDYYFNQADNCFKTTFNSDSYFKTTKNGESIANKWVDIGENGQGILLPVRDDTILNLYNIISGDFNLQIWSNTKVRKQGGDLLTNDSILDETWIKDLQISIVYIDGSEINDVDKEFIGKLDPLFSQEGEEIVLKCGSMSQYSDRGKILRANGDTYADMIVWTRAGQSFKIEELLLNSLCSNYRANYVTLTGMKLKNEFSMMNVLTDSAYLGTKKLMVKSSVIDPANYVNEVTLVEISPDELTIVKE